jgi:hypothetical protein
MAKNEHRSELRRARVALSVGPVGGGVPVQASEPTRRGRPPRKPIRYAVAELQALLSYLQHNVAKQASLREVHKTIEERRAASGDPRLRAYQWHSFNDRWFDAMRHNMLPSWEQLVQPWALAFGGEHELAVVEQLYDAIGPAEIRGRIAAEESDTTRRSPGNNHLTGNAAVDALLSQIVASTANVVQTDRTLFIDAIMPQLHEICRSIRPWRDGSVDADSTNYDSIIIRACRDATEVKATSIPEFTPRWMQSYGDRLVAAHVESGAQVTRIFLFDSLQDALEDVAQQVMLTQVLIPAMILIYIRDEASVTPPPGRVWDFAFIDDGELISEAIFHDGEYSALKLYFSNRDATADYRAFFERMSLHSMEYGTFMTRRGGHRDIRSLLADLARLLGKFGGDSDLARRARDLTVAYDEAGAQAARSELCEQAIELVDEADRLPLQAAATTSVPSAYSYLLRAAKSEAQIDIDRGTGEKTSHKW